MSSYDEVIADELMGIKKQTKRIADGIEQLVEQGRILKDAKAISSVLQAEDKQFTKETLEIAEEVIMDLNDVQVIVQTEKALLVTKKGFQKWIPKSFIEEPKIVADSFYGNIIIRTEKKGEEKNAPDDWFHKKKWDKLQVVKK